MRSYRRQLPRRHHRRRRRQDNSPLSPTLEKRKKMSYSDSRCCQKKFARDKSHQT